MCYEIGDSARAAEIYEELAPFAAIHLADGRPPAGCRGYGAHYLGMLATLLERYDDAERHFAHALQLHDAMGSKPYVAETRLRAAEMLLRRDAGGDKERAAEMLGSAAEIAERLGAQGLLDRIRSRL